MSPITSARCVKLFAIPSYYSLQANTIALCLVCTAICVSAIPLPVSVYLLFLVVKAYLTQGFLLTGIQGDIEFTSPHIYQANDQNRAIRKVVFSFAALGLLIIHQDKSRMILWRDSLSEGEYRDLVVWLKQEY